MRALKQGDRGQAICPACRAKVTTTHEYRTIRLERRGVDVENVLVGVCDLCGEIVSIPAESLKRHHRLRGDP